jgi:hypothetical protein
LIGGFHGVVFCEPGLTFPPLRTGALKFLPDNVLEVFTGPRWKMGEAVSYFNPFDQNVQHCRVPVVIWALLHIEAEIGLVEARQFHASGFHSAICDEVIVPLDTERIFENFSANVLECGAIMPAFWRSIIIFSPGFVIVHHFPPFS